MISSILQPIVEVFSFLAIATSYIGFILGLTDFVADCKLYLLLCAKKKKNSFLNTFHLHDIHKFIDV